jgi:PilZ domain
VHSAAAEIEEIEVMEERRRAPRFEMVGGQPAILPVSMSVRILDISLSGVLVESRQPAKEGSHGRLRLNMGGMPFLAEVEIRRVSASAEGAHRIGAMFVELSRDHQQMITRFTQR